MTQNIGTLALAPDPQRSGWFVASALPVAAEVAMRDQLRDCAAPGSWDEALAELVTNRVSTQPQPALPPLAPPPTDADAPVRPELETLAEASRAINAAAASAIAALVALRQTGGVKAETGLSTSQWLSRVSHTVRWDSGAMELAADVLSDMPGMLAEFEASRVSWGQIRAITKAVRPLSRHDRGQVDNAATAAAPDYATADPVLLTSLVHQHVDEILHAEAETAEQRSLQHEFVSMTPYEDGSGVDLHAGLTPQAGALFAAMIDAFMPPPTGLENSHIEGANARNQARITRRRAAALTAFLEHAATNMQRAATGPRPQVNIVASLEALTGASEQPGHILTTLTGGTLNITAAAIRNLVNNHGADLRTIIVNEHGAAVGYGRRTRLAPQTLRDISNTLHPTCIYPDCQRSALNADLDHARGFKRGRAPTNISELAPLCRQHHREKDRPNSPWTLTPANHRGERTWTHKPTGHTWTIPPQTRRL